MVMTLSKDQINVVVNQAWAHMLSRALDMEMHVALYARIEVNSLNINEEG